MNNTSVSITDLKLNTAGVLKNVTKMGEVVTIFQRSRPKAILVDVDYFKALEESVLDLTDTKEAEKAKKESRVLLSSYAKKRWGR